jgi:hypothetical protein
VDVVVDVEVLVVSPVGVVDVLVIVAEFEAESVEALSSPPPPQAVMAAATANPMSKCLFTLSIPVLRPVAAVRRGF